MTNGNNRFCSPGYCSAMEDGQNCLKHVELIEVINKIIIVASSWLFVLLYQ